MKFQTLFPNLKGELQRESKLISYERVFKMLENDTYITGIGQAILELLSFKLGQGITKGESPSKIFGHLRSYEARSTENDVTSDKSQFPNIKN